MDAHSPPSLPYHLVIFDFDGTLADTYPWFLSVFDEFAARYHLPRLDNSALDALRKVDIRYISREYNIPFWKITQMGIHLQQQMASQIDRIQLVDGMQTVIDNLRSLGVKLAVVSSNTEENVRQVLGAENAVHFEAFECGVSLFGKKLKFEKIMRRTGIPPAGVLSIGDEVRDLKSSRQAGMTFGAVTWGYGDAEILRENGPDALFNHPEEILTLFDGKLRTLE